MNVSTIAWFIIIIIALTLPVIVVKKYITTNNYCYLILAIIIYTIVVFGYANILSQYPIHYMFGPWFISMALALFAGVLLFDEKIKPINIVGIVIGFVAIYLVLKK